MLLLSFPIVSLLYKSGPEQEENPCIRQVMSTYGTRSTTLSIEISGYFFTVHSQKSRLEFQFSRYRY